MRTFLFKRLGFDWLVYRNILADRGFQSWDAIVEETTQDGEEVIPNPDWLFSQHRGPNFWVQIYKIYTLGDYPQPMCVLEEENAVEFKMIFNEYLEPEPFEEAFYS
jgi:hypothetical protein